VYYKEVKRSSAKKLRRRSPYIVEGLLDLPFRVHSVRRHDHIRHLLDDDGALHAGALVGLAVVAVGAGGVELVGHLLAGAVEVILVGDGVGVDAGGDVVLVEDDVVGERLVVDELDGLALGDGDLVGLLGRVERGGGGGSGGGLNQFLVVGFLDGIVGLDP
jgi:hypothetical protein